ncbi:MAG: hypothetical protein LIP77_01895 [Planctomycetes bacterium]|nr:hypothetical protein [Planctomycetota bacterium]
MAGSELLTPPRELSLWAMQDVIIYVARYYNYRSALGYSILFFVENMAPDRGVRILAVDGVHPDLNTIADGSYPLTEDIYAVTTKNSHPDAVRVVEWLRSPQGQRLVLANGFAPIMPTE